MFNFDQSTEHKLSGSCDKAVRIDWAKVESSKLRALWVYFVKLSQRPWSRSLKLMRLKEHHLMRPAMASHEIGILHHDRPAEALQDMPVLAKANSASSLPTPSSDEESIAECDAISIASSSPEPVPKKSRSVMFEAPKPKDLETILSAMRCETHDHQGHKNLANVIKKRPAAARASSKVAPRAVVAATAACAPPEVAPRDAVAARVPMVDVDETSVIERAAALCSDESACLRQCRVSRSKQRGSQYWLILETGAGQTRQLSMVTEKQFGGDHAACDRAASVLQEVASLGASKEDLCVVKASLIAGEL